MKTLSIIYLFFLSVGIYAQKSNVKITVKASKSTNARLIASLSNLLGGKDTLAQQPLNAQGEGSVIFHLSKPSFVLLDINNQQFNCYLTPNDNLEVMIEMKDKKPVFSFSGKGAEANNYLAQSLLVFNQYFTFNGKQINELKAEEFASRLDTMKKAFVDFHQNYTSKVSMSPSTSALLALCTRMIPLSFKHNYIMAYFNTFEERAQMPVSLKKVYGEIPLNDELLNAKYSEYAGVLMYQLYDLWLPFFAGKTAEEKRKIYLQLPDYAEQTIKKGPYSSTVKEFLLAKNVYDGFDQGITPVSMLVFNHFKTEFPNSNYLSAIEKKYNKWLSIAKGTSAPDFKGLTPEGNTLSLSDLKGKIVYADLWATWCGPCREELPKAKEIQRQFADNKQVAFLYVSVDTETEKWKTFLTKDPDFKGTHINISDDAQISQLYKDYQMSGVPTYLLIDQEGKIVSANASRPSSGKVAEEIRALLK
jgi:thiol-disulfide isomerase/thioredoxin